MKANNQNSKTSQVTARHEVGFFTPNGKALFSVNEGIPMSQAFDQLSLLLSSAQGTVEALAVSSEDTSETGAHWASAHLLTFAYALVQSMHKGHVESQNISKTEPAEGAA